MKYPSFILFVTKSGATVSIIYEIHGEVIYVIGIHGLKTFVHTQPV